MKRYFPHFLIGFIIISLLQLYNGFPLLLGDSMGYVDRAITGNSNSHWSNTYTIFNSIIIKSVDTFQGVPVLQNILTVILIVILTDRLFPKLSFIDYFLLWIVLLFTPLPWISSMLMSDIFVPISMIIIILVICYDNSTTNMLLYFLIALFSFSAHQSNLLILPLFLLTVSAFGLLVYKKKLSHILSSIALIMITMFISFYIEKNGLDLINPKVEKQTIEVKKEQHIKSGYRFVITSLNDHKYLDDILSDFCKKSPENYFCSAEIDEKGKIKMPKKIPLNRRTPKNDEYFSQYSDMKEIVLYTIYYPNNWQYYIKLFFNRGLAMLKKTNIREYGKFKKPIAVAIMSRRFKEISAAENSSYLKSQQHLDVLKNNFTNTYNTYIANIWNWICLFAIIPFLYLLYLKKYNIYLSIILLLIIGHIINTMVCGTFSNMNNARYNSRTLWLVYLGIFYLLVVIKYNVKPLNKKINTISDISE